MTKPTDIIGIVKELQTRECCCEYEQCGRCIDVVDNFPAIAQTLLTKDEQLKMAIEALEQFEKYEKLAAFTTKEGTALPSTPASNALKRIRSKEDTM